MNQSEPIKKAIEIHLLDIMESSCPDTAELFSRKDEVRRLYKTLRSSLTEQEQEVIKLRYGLFGEENLTPEEYREAAGHQPLLRLQN